MQWGLLQRYHVACCVWLRRTQIRSQNTAHIFRSHCSLLSSEGFNTIHVPFKREVQPQLQTYWGGGKWNDYMAPDNLPWISDGNKDRALFKVSGSPLMGEMQGDILLSDAFHLVFISKPVACCVDDMTNKDTGAGVVRENRNISKRHPAKSRVVVFTLWEKLILWAYWNYWSLFNRIIF